MAKRIGTRTRAQVQNGTLSVVSSIGSIARGVSAAHANVHGISSAPSGNYQTYRSMRCNPTVAVARAAMFAPIKASAWSYEAMDGVPDERVKFVQDQMSKLRQRLLDDVLRSIEYGWQPFERVYNFANGRIGYARIKALLPDKTEAVVDERTGQLLGVRNDGVTLSLAEAAVVTYDGEGDDPYGRSIYENIRVSAWWPWVDASRKLAQYMTKGAGVIPIVHYPMGTSVDFESGSTADNSEGAALLLRALASGAGVTIPNMISKGYEDLLVRGANVDQLAAWRVSFLETRSGVGNEIIEAMRHYEKLIVRGMLQPERAILEGQSGTRADAGSHADLALTMAIDRLEWVIDRINRLFVDPLLALNFGPDARGSVYIVPAPIRDDDREFLRGLLSAVLTANPDLLFAVADFDAMLDAANIPKSAEVVDVDRARQQQPQTAPTPGMAALAREIRAFRQLGIV
jgi:hypothetical protein